MALRVPFAIFCTFLGCCSNIVILEYLIKADPGAGNLVTFLQFAFVAIDGFLFTSKCGTRPLNVGLLNYVKLVTMFFLTSVLNNYAFNFNIPMPLSMIFRSGALIGNMTLGVFYLKKRYAFMKYFSVLMITIGIIICTIATGSSVKGTKHFDKSIQSGNASVSETGTDMDALEEYSTFLWWLVGIGMLTFCLFLTSLMGIFQELLCKRYGKHPREGLYISHLLPLPAFLFLYNNLAEHMKVATASEPVTLPLIGGSVPILWLFLIANCFTQYMCISSLFVLSTEISSLTLSLIVTLRKFSSLLISIVYFKNNFTTYHWVGTVLVFLGTILFSGALERIWSRCSDKTPMLVWSRLSHELKKKIK